MQNKPDLSEIKRMQEALEQPVTEEGARNMSDAAIANYTPEAELDRIAEALGIKRHTP